MAEWSNATVLKTVGPARVPRVRIPLSPPDFARRLRPTRLRLATPGLRPSFYVVRLYYQEHWSPFFVRWFNQ